MVTQYAERYSFRERFRQVCQLVGGFPLYSFNYRYMSNINDELNELDETEEIFTEEDEYKENIELPQRHLLTETLNSLR